MKDSRGIYLPKYGNDIKEQARQLRKKNFTLREISAIIKVSPSVIGRWVKDITEAKQKFDEITYQHKYREQHKQQRSEYDKLRYKKNKEYFREKNKNYYLDHREDRINNQREYYINNKEKIIAKNKEYIKNRRHDNIIFKLHESVSKRINVALKRNKKFPSVIQHLSYTIEQLKIHLESLFEPWMNWNNWGQYRVENWNDKDPSTWTWQIDHIIPVSKLKYSSFDDPNFLKVWDLQNLRPLASKLNIKKGNR